MAKVQYGVFLNGQYIDTKDLKEAEDRFKRVEKSDFSFTFIVTSTLSVLSRFGISPDLDAKSVGDAPPTTPDGGLIS